MKLDDYGPINYRIQVPEKLLMNHGCLNPYRMTDTILTMTTTLDMLQSPVQHTLKTTSKQA